MVQSHYLALTATSLLLLPGVYADGLYPKSSSVLQVDGSSYKDLIANSNHTSIVEFYAPWCGHCKNLQPAYEKAAKSLTGLAKVAAVNCDEEKNKQFCGKMGVQGFPTLKIVKPGKKPGNPIVEDYNGARTAKAIVDYVVDKIPNKVKHLKDEDYAQWLETNDKPKAILFSNKGSVSALLKAVAIDFLDVVDVGQLRDKDTQAVEKFGIKKFPSLILVPSAGAEPISYDGELKKDPIVTFLSQAASPNPDPAPKTKQGKNSSTNKSKASKASSSFAKASQSDRSSKSQSAKASQTAEVLEEENQPFESPSPEVDSAKPAKVADVIPPLDSLVDRVVLQQKCLNSKASTCVLVLTPEVPAESAAQAIAVLSELHNKYERTNHALFPFYQLPSSNAEASTLRSKLPLSGDDIQIIAVNGKRGWYRKYSKSSFAYAELEEWIDDIRMGQLPKLSLPEDLVVNAAELPVESAKPEGAADASSEDTRESLKQQIPDGVNMEFEEISDDDYQRIMAKASAEGSKAAAKESAADTHDEL